MQTNMIKGKQVADEFIREDYWLEDEASPVSVTGSSLSLAIQKEFHILPPLLNREPTSYSD